MTIRNWLLFARKLQGLAALLIIMGWIEESGCLMIDGIPVFRSIGEVVDFLIAWFLITAVGAFILRNLFDNEVE